MTVPALTLAGVLMLAACEAPEDVPQREAPHPPGAAQSAAAETRFDLASGLAGRTPFTLPAMEAAFPGYQVVSRLEDPASGTPPAFEIRAAGSDAALFVITPDWSRGHVGEVSTTHPAVTGPLGLRAGMTRLSAVTAASGETCALMPDAAGGPLACEVSADGARLRLEFAEEGDDPLLSRIVLLPNLP